MPDAWPFADPPNVAVFTLKRILEEGKPILCVNHDEEDGGWQFLDGGEVSMKDSALVSLATMVRLDASLNQLADLPLGWCATRLRPEDPWTRAPYE